MYSWSIKVLRVSHLALLDVQSLPVDAKEIKVCLIVFGSVYVVRTSSWTLLRPPNYCIPKQHPTYHPTLCI